MSITELRKDSEELSKFIQVAIRSRVKNVLLATKAEVDREIATLGLEQVQVAEVKNSSAIVAKRYLFELKDFGWTQSDKFVKVFVTLKDVENVSEDNVTVQFTENSMELSVQHLDNKDYRLTINNLIESIDVEKSYRTIKPGRIVIYMKKQEEMHWNELTNVQKRIQNTMKKPSESEDSLGDSLFDITKKLYQSGDAKTKQMINKAMSENSRNGPGGGGMPMF